MSNEIPAFQPPHGENQELWETIVSSRGTMPMVPGEPSWASLKYMGGPHLDDVLSLSPVPPSNRESEPVDVQTVQVPPVFESLQKFWENMMP